MARSEAAEWQQFQAERLQASRLLDSRFAAANTNREKNENESEASNTNLEQSRVIPRQRRSSNTQKKSQKKSSAKPITQLKVLKKDLKEIETRIAKNHSELGQFYKMLFSQWIPVSFTSGATLLEILDGGLLSLFATFFAIVVRFFWFFMQSPKVKIWLRTKQLAQMVIMSLISMIPFIGVFLQTDLISTTVITPVATWRKIRSLRKKIKSDKKMKRKLKNKIKSLKSKLN